MGRVDGGSASLELRAGPSFNLGSHVWSGTAAEADGLTVEVPCEPDGMSRLWIAAGSPIGEDQDLQAQQQGASKFNLEQAEIVFF